VSRLSYTRGNGAPTALIVGLPVHPRRLEPVVTITHPWYGGKGRFKIINGAYAVKSEVSRSYQLVAPLLGPDYLTLEEIMSI